MSHRVNIIIPCWNISALLSYQLDSILAQTYQNWRVVAVDDQSTDNTVEILQRYHHLDERITYLIRDREPKGAPTCRNIGLEHSMDADYIMFVDADDLLAPYCLEQRVAFMEEHKELDFSVFPAKQFFDDPWKSGTFIIGVDDRQDDVEGFLIPVMPFSMWNALFRRPENIEMLSWEEHLLSLQDSEILLRVILNDARYTYAPDAQIDYFWRRVEGSITTKIFSKRNMENNFFYFEKVFDMMSDVERNRYRNAVLCNLLGYYEKIKSDSDLLGKFMRLKWIQYSCWFRLRLYLYGWMFVNSKLRHLLFPELVRLYLRVQRIHDDAMKEAKVHLLSDMDNKDNNIT